MKSNKLRMYILVKDSVPDDYVPLMVAHAAINCIFKYGSLPVDEVYPNIPVKEPLFLYWYLHNNMAKVICRVSEREFQQACEEADDYIIQSETNGLDPGHLTNCVVAFVPRSDYPDCFKHYELWKVKKTDSQIALDLINRGPY
jgi:hypothetical protein